MCKMSVAVAVGAAITRLPRWLVAVVTGVSFIGVAFTIWRKPDVRRPKAKDSAVLKGRGRRVRDDLALGVGRRRAGHGRRDGREVRLVGAIGCVGRHLADGDRGLARRGCAPWSPRGALASLLGAGVRMWIAERIQPRVVRYVATAAILVLGTLSVLETLGILVD